MCCGHYFPVNAVYPVPYPNPSWMGLCFWYVWIFLKFKKIFIGCSSLCMGYVCMRQDQGCWGWGFLCDTSVWMHSTWHKDRDWTNFQQFWFCCYSTEHGFPYHHCWSFWVLYVSIGHGCNFHRCRNLLVSFLLQNMVWLTTILEDIALFITAIRVPQFLSSPQSICLLAT